MKLLGRFALVSLVVYIASHGFAEAYDNTVTHRWLTFLGYESSDVKEILPLLGIDRNVAVNAITTGAVDEDSPDDRCLNHFYNPQTGHGYASAPFLSTGAVVCVGLRTCVPSPNWILEEEGQESVHTGSPHSYTRAVDLFYRALTSVDPNNPSGPNVRKLIAKQIFEELGHVLHHIQDMAQPQHVRLDSHRDLLADFLPITPFEEYVKSKNAQIRAMNPLPVYSRTNPSSDFKTPKDFWKNDNQTGIAEYARNNFVTDGTNFKPDCSAPNGFVAVVNGQEGFPDPDPFQTSPYFVTDPLGKRRLYLGFEVAGAGRPVPISATSALSPTVGAVCKGTFSQDSTLPIRFVANHALG